MTDYQYEGRTRKLRDGSYGGSVVSEVAPEIGALARLETKAGDHFIVKIVGVEMKIAAEGFQTEYVCRTENLPRDGDDNGGHPSWRKDDDGEYRVYARPSQVAVGKTVSVRKANGEFSDVEIVSVGDTNKYGKAMCNFIPVYAPLGDDNGTEF